jgi:excisionase family DNA binding protein
MSAVVAGHLDKGSQADRLAPAREIAAMLGVSRSTVLRLVERGELVPVRLSARCTRYRVSDVEALVARLTGGTPEAA